MRDELIEELSQQFMVLMPLLHKKIFDRIPEEDLPALHLTPANGRLLIILNEMRRATVSDLSQQISISRPNMTPLIDKLVQEGLACRKPCTQDRRVTYIEITPKGDQICGIFHRVIAGRVKDMLSGLEEEDLNDMIVHMNRMKEILLKTGT
ncbi:MarR family winged helix-turn-helix transcriptional regulator [Paenibacillus tarimensis]|uniref:MarR family winged helix-turn-helix transcriptional regulator n=1 Tax=Paenibacillus tarimensis TaxID=416012 RepID=UPI001F26761C|nr:MarR family transcriptional regulator [Paenibacillus tarimensis]MCF2942888.1 MarR family transcriptional regulator [Paenibacillus tarimensis]